MNDDAALMALAAKGDSRAFRTLVEKYQGQMYNFFLRSTGNPEDSEDLSQQLFINLYRSASRYRPEASFKTFIYRIASNLAISFARKRARRESVYSLDELAEGGREPQGSPEGEGPAAYSEQREFERAYLEALMRLPADWRVAMELRVGKGLTYREIAEVMDKSVPAIESIIFRARERLAIDLKDFRENA